MATQTDLVVIGAGPGGYAAAFYAADRGLSVALIDREPNPGGVCVYRGCIPSKALLHVAKVIEEATHASSWGVSFGAPKIDVDKLRGFKDRVVRQLTSGTGQLVKARKIKYLRGTATLLGPTSLEVALLEGGTEQVTFGHAIIAVGSRPAKVPVLSVDDSPRIMDSTGALDLENVPKSLLVIGGGYIGLELGSVYATLGTKVTVVEMMPGLLPGADRDLVAVLAKRIEKICEAVLLETKVVGVKEQKDGVNVTFEDANLARRDQVFEKVLVSVGRKPNTMAGLDKTKVETDQRGFIKVDARRRTAEPTLYAIGDVAGEPMLAHKASARRSRGRRRDTGRRRRIRTGRDPGRCLHRPRAGVDWSDRNRSAEAGEEGRDLEVPLDRVRPRAVDRSHGWSDEARHRAWLRTRARRRDRRAQARVS